MTSIDRRSVLKSAIASACAPAIWGLAGNAVLADDKPAVKVEKLAKAPKPDPYIDAKFVAGAPSLPAKDKFTVVVLPDTQHYSEDHPKNYHAQTKWIVENKDARRISAVLHLGDITNHSSLREWENAQAAMNRLDGQVPYFMVPGNHDYGDKGNCVSRKTHFNEYFPLSKFKDTPTFGGVYDKEPDRFENSYHKFSAGGRDFLVVGLEYGPRKDVVRWANEVVAENSKREAILITHAYMYFDETRYDWKKYGTKQKWNPHTYGVARSSKDDVMDGEELWSNLVNKHDNFIMTLNGHVLFDGLGRLDSKNAAGKNVHQLLVNFQMKPNGGDGWLRLLEFSNDGRSVDVVDFSPTRDECNVSGQNKFSLQYA